MTGSSGWPETDGINSSTGQITVANKAAVDFETTPVFHLTVAATDSDGAVGTAPVTINLDNLSATLSIGDVSVVEGDSGTTAMVFTVSLSNGINDDFTVNYSTANDTATTADNDYASVSGALSYSGTAAESQQITVNVNGDDKAEANETLKAALSGLAGTNDVMLIGSATQAGGGGGVFGTMSGPRVGFFYQSGTGTFTNTTSTPLVTGTTYNLTFAIGQRDAYAGSFAGYKIELLSGGTSIASMSSATSPAGAGTFGDVTLTYTATGAEPAGLLGIRIGVLAFGDHLDFDNVRLTGNGTPITVTNFNFESPALSDGGINIGNMPGWTQTGNGLNGTFNPNSTVWYLTTADEDSTPTTIGGVTATGTIVNDDYAPVANAGGAYTINEGQGVTLNASASTDADSSSLTYRWDVNGDGSYSENVTGVTPTLSAAQMPSLGLADGLSSRTIRVEVSDGTNVSTATGTLTINNVAPTFEAGADETIQPPQLGAFSRNGIGITDPGSPETFSGTVNFGDGSGTQTLTINQPTRQFDLSHTFPNTNAAPAIATYHVVVTVNDGDGGSHTDAFDVTVNLNTPPVAVDDTPSTDEDHSVTINVLANDTDNQNNIDPSQTVNLTSPSVGTLTNNGDGTFSFNPGSAFQYLAVGESATVTFDYRVFDAFGEHDDGTVTLTITGVNDTPNVATNSDSITVNEGQSASNSGSWSDIDASDVVTLTASVGTVTKNTDGSWSWSFNTNDGPDQSQTVTITANDGHGGIATTTFDLTVNNVAPSVANAGNVTVNEGSTATNSGTWSDPGLDVVTLSASAGTVTKNANGTWNWSFNSNDSPDQSQTVTITATDSDGASTTTSFNLTVNNVAPDAVNDSYSTPQATLLTGNVITGGGADTDPAGANDPLTVIAVNGVAANVGQPIALTNGTLTLNANGSFSYQPATTFVGTESFTYTIGDGDGGSDTATVTIVVNAAPGGSILTVVDTCCSCGKTALLITGTSANDHIVVAPGSTSATLQVNVNGAISTVARPSGRIIVLGLAGNDNIQIAGAISNSVWLYGDAGDDRLNAGNVSAEGNLLFGGDGNDDLLGGNGRDVLIGGQGADKITANANDDILIAGLTTHDARNSAAHEEFWCNVLHEWTELDPFSTRVNRLRTGSGHTGVNLLSSVVDDNSADQIDQLQGSADNDWFLFKSGEDKVVGQMEASN